MTRGPRPVASQRRRSAPGDAGGPLLAAVGTGIGAVIGGLGAGWLGYLYAAATFPDQEFAAIPIIVYGAFAGGIAIGTVGCWLALLVGRRTAPGGTALRALAFLIMLVPILLLSAPALDLDQAGKVIQAGLAAAIIGAVARLLTPERGASAAGPRW